ncbi:DUF4337 domain-containing protein [Paenibacillus larvae]|uniref:Uncharacterized protein n=3 Tax=Halcyonevirus C7Cdelta TaxID=2845733 RepID=A0A345ASM1_9CAUD|nr:DUF4337 domain-containing protein [Paenibacillus larvae]YP_010082231.1 hypothetical protein KMD17_gp64 [Paenibacillus phage C7Cdelta]AXF39991.1 hypothetical protein ASH_64 [Paenibacillus phage Ash]AXF40278.1 hypothetical protein LEY_64 [Paenibacillus phage Ley]AXF39825.1 hypothetical protein C7CDELTA_64 [Paenibacillus phage C7Cdelta]MDT2293973.1 DUF4337 domain-containing protein [Paenibacillus larvae]
MTPEDYAHTLEYLIADLQRCIDIKEHDLDLYRKRLNEYKSELEEIRHKYRHYEKQRK